VEEHRIWAGVLRRVGGGEPGFTGVPRAGGTPGTNYAGTVICLTKSRGSVRPRPGGAGASTLLWHRLLGRPASECGKLRHGDGDSEGGNRCRRGLVLTILVQSLACDEEGEIAVLAALWRTRKKEIVCTARRSESRSSGKTSIVNLRCATTIRAATCPDFSPGSTGDSPIWRSTEA
jgi:hypothetical protein